MDPHAILVIPDVGSAIGAILVGVGFVVAIIFVVGFAVTHRG